MPRIQKRTTERRYALGRGFLTLTATGQGRTRHRAFSLAETNDFLGTQTQLGSQTRVGYAGWCTKRTEEC